MCAARPPETVASSGGGVSQPLADSAASLAVLALSFASLTSFGSASYGCLPDMSLRSKVGNGAVNGVRMRAMKTNAHSFERLCARRRADRRRLLARGTPTGLAKFVLSDALTES